MTLSQRVGRLESLASTGKIAGRDLEVIRMQLSRAEDKVIRRITGSATTKTPVVFVEDAEAA